MRTMKFTKMHGCGNDFVMVDAITEPALAELLAHPEWASQVVRMCDRRRGIGADGVIMVCPPAPSDTGVACTMRIFNADGSEAQMCGNGIRCLARLMTGRHVSPSAPLAVRTGRGVLVVDVCVNDRGSVMHASVLMGAPDFELAHVPVRAGLVDALDSGEIELDVGVARVRLCAVSMGNPHAVVFIENTPQESDLTALGPRLEHHPAFPERTNVHMAMVDARARAVRVRTWERGAGLTLACGTGACAVVAAALRTKRLEPDGEPVRVHQPGGTLLIARAPDGQMRMEGPAEFSFVGGWTLPWSSETPG